MIALHFLCILNTKYDWWELPTAQKEAATFLGYDEESWCEGTCDLLEADITTPSPSKSPTNRPTPNVSQKF